ncbi:MAG TPA: RNA 2',3'-cyclic phosphodiesterase, partial [Gammaproteobacteria bacterium]|nr:RNA 2',3'-cyclic phosphodiesterase [Gammaproteobacteria bacterium]
GIGAFPSLRRPRVLWLGVRPVAELTALQSHVSRSLEPLGFAPDTRPYSPHVTLARTRGQAGPTQFAGLEAAAQKVSYAALVSIGSVELMRSHAGRASAHYEVLRTAALEGSATIEANGKRRID